MKPKRRAVSLGLLALALVPAGCASPNPDLLTLDALPGAVLPGGPRHVLLQDVALAPYLDRKAIVRSSEGYHIEVATNDWWGEPFGAMLGRVLSAEIEQRLPSTTVFTESSAVDVHAEATVAINVTRFDEAADSRVVLVAQIGVTFPNQARAAVTQGLRFTAPVSGKGVTAQAAAMSVALGQLADRLAQALSG